MKNSLAILKEIQDENPTRTYIKNALFPQDPRPSKTFITEGKCPILSKCHLTHIGSQKGGKIKRRAASQENIVTFHDLYKQVENSDKQFKDTSKLSLKQLELKKKERMSMNNEEKDYSNIIKMHQLESMQLYDTRKFNGL